MRRLLILSLIIGTAGCVSSGDVELLHREITDVARQVEELGQQSSGKQDLQAVGQKLTEQNTQMLRSSADIRAELEQLRDQIERLQANLEATNQRLEALSNELAAARERATAPSPTGMGAAPEAGTPSGAAAVPAAGGTAPSEPAQLYTSAYEDYLRGNFDLALQGFAEYQRRFPDTDLADNALYWIGECHYSKRQFVEAIQSFTQLLNTYKTSDKAAGALLKKGLAHLESGDRSQAVINLQYVLYEHPGSKEADLARQKLAALGVKVK